MHPVCYGRGFPRSRHVVLRGDHHRRPGGLRLSRVRRRRDRHKAQNGILLLSLLIAPLFFLVGLGAFDYWFRWAAGKPTIPEDHSGHGATSWKDYFRVNTDHKVIGIQYVVTSFFFMLVGGLLAMMVRAELMAPGRQFVDAGTLTTGSSASTRR